MATLFISDLHLDATRPEITAQFLSFLRNEARTAEALYILGDLFELWIGDDDPEPEKQRIVAALRALTASGVPCYVMHGNRDFLLGRRFAAASGCALIPDGTVIELHGTRAVLLHGDTLCTDDHSYQRLRRIVRNPLLKGMLRVLPLRQRNRLATRLRAGSQAHTSRTAPMIMDVNALAVEDAFRRYGTPVLIHGHTHRPAVHQLEVDGRLVTRIVLGDWYDQGSLLSWDAEGYALAVMPRAA